MHYNEICHARWWMEHGSEGQFDFKNILCGTTTFNFCAYKSIEISA